MSSYTLKDLKELDEEMNEIERLWDVIDKKIREYGFVGEETYVDTVFECHDLVTAMIRRMEGEHMKRAQDRFL